MIDFPCICGQPFSLDDSQAGTQFQCPACGRLVDVPSLNDLVNLKEDGTYHLDLAPAAPEANRIEHLTRVYQWQRTDDQGREIDLRQRPEDFERIGASEASLPPIGSVRPAAPRYDPLTGELVRPIELQDAPVLNNPKPRPAPAGRSRTLSYAEPMKSREITPSGIPREMILLQNQAVMLFMFGFHIALLITSVVLASGLVFVAFAEILLFFAIIGHYAVVIEETGPGDMDELPRPLRHVSIGEDIWNPFVQTVFAFIVCFLPALLLVERANAGLRMAGWLLGIVGIYLFPAALLTSVTSGLLVNMRPDRIHGTAARMGADYLVIVVVFVLGIACYTLGLGGIVLDGLHLFVTRYVPSLFGRPPPGMLAATGFMLLAIVLLHYVCWYLGLMWRRHHANFPWVGQVHIRSEWKIAKAARQGPAAQAPLTPAMRKYEARQAQRRAERGLP